MTMRETAAPGRVSWERLTRQVRGTWCDFCKKPIHPGDDYWLGAGMHTRYAAHPLCLDAFMGSPEPDDDPGPDLEER